MSLSVAIDYTNHRGERSVRRIIPMTGTMRYASNEWHKETQWLFDAHDLDKKAIRTFALKDVHEWRP